MLLLAYAPLRPRLCVEVKCCCRWSEDELDAASASGECQLPRGWNLRCIVSTTLVAPPVMLNCGFSACLIAALGCRAACSCLVLLDGIAVLDWDTLWRTALTVVAFGPLLTCLTWSGVNVVSDGGIDSPSGVDARLAAVAAAVEFLK